MDRPSEPGRVYDGPEYYELAFSFRDIPAEVDVMQECMRRFSGIPVHDVLELGCGNSPHMPELCRRCFSYTGLDLSEAMLEYSRARASEAGCRADFVRADMNDFSLKNRHDFAFITLGSLQAPNTEGLYAHFRCVAEALKPGGLYLLDWCIEFELPVERGTTWVMEDDGIIVETTVSWRTVSAAEQVFEEIITMEVEDEGYKLSLEERTIRRAIYPQEFLLMAEALDGFEFAGWWNNWDLSRPIFDQKLLDRPIALLKRL